MAVNKVVFGNTTVMDITDSTVNANNLLSGNKAYGADGEPVFGSLSVGSTINVTTTDPILFGETLTLSDGTTTLTTAFDNSGEATFTSVLLIGILTLSCGGFSMTISVPSYDTYNVEFTTVPNGKVVTPTDDIQIWLACANITDKSYTTLAEVLADREIFETLIADSNACDYMARSASWSGSDNLVPTMTSATTPSGEASGINYNNTYPPYLAFDGNDSTFCAINAPSNSGTGMTDRWVQYHFTNAVVINKFLMKYQNTHSSYHDYITKVKLQGSNNGSTFTDITTETISSTTEEKIFSNNTAYEYYRFLIVDGTVTNYNMISFMILTLELGFIGITNNETAMALIGKYDYCSNALLNNATWREAICNSDYFEEVLNVKVPTMTGNTAPSGKVSASSIYSSTYAAYLAFDGGSATTFGWCPSNSSPTGDNTWIQYQFTNSVSVNKIKISKYANDYPNDYTTTIKLLGSNDGFVNDSHEIVSDLTFHHNGGEFNYFNFANTATYLYYRIVLTATTGSFTAGNGFKLQFYGRTLSEVLIPLVPTMTSDTTPSGVASADSTNGPSYEAYRAFDNAVSTTDAWMSGSVASSYNFPHWIQYQFPTAQVVGGLHFKNYSTGSSGVKTFKVQGSNDGTTWTDLYSGTGTNASGGTLQKFYFDNTTAYLYYRLYITEGYSSIQCGICYLQFLRTQSLTNIIHSCPNDTIYMMEDGSPVVLTTTNSDGNGILDFSQFEEGTYTLYSSVAKDIETFTNDFSKSIRITKTLYGGTTEAYLLPDVKGLLYWYGYESDNLEDLTSTNGWTISGGYTLKAPTHNTNSITMTGGNGQFSGVATKKSVTGTTAYVYSNGTWLVESASKTSGLSPRSLGSNLINLEFNGTGYLWDGASPGPNILYAFWYE